MLNSAHFIFGSAIAYKTPDPYFGIFLAFLSHFALDIIPHYDGPIKDGKEVDSIDYSFLKYDVVVAAPLLIYLYLKFGFNLSVFGGALAGIFPDIMDNVIWWRMLTRKLFIWKWIRTVHKSTHLVFKDKIRYIKVVGTLTQIFIIIISLIWIGF